MLCIRPDVHRKLTLIRWTEPVKKNTVLQSLYEGLARLCWRVKASDLEVYDCLPGIVVLQRSGQSSLDSRSFHLPFLFPLDSRASPLG